MTLPLRLMTLHFSHMGFTDGLTFIVETSYECLMAPRRRGLRGVRPALRTGLALLRRSSSPKRESLPFGSPGGGKAPPEYGPRRFGR